MDTYSTMKPTNFLLKCFALNCICLKDNKIISSWSLFKNLLIILILCSINLTALYTKIQDTDFQSNEFTFTDAINFLFILSFLKYIVDLIYVRKYGTEKCVIYYYAYDKIDKILKITNYSKIKIICFKIMMSTCAFHIFSTILDNIVWNITFGYINISYNIDYVYSFEVLLIILDAVSHVVQIEYRLHRLGDIIEEVNGNNKDISKCVTVCSSVSYESTGLDILETLRATENCTWTPDDILLLSQSYLMLIKQTEFINSTFGFRILLTCISYLVHLIDLCNIAIRFMFGKVAGSCKLPALSSILLVLGFCSNMFILAHRCEKVYRQSDRIIAVIDDLIIYRKARKETILPLKELRELISRRQIRFHTSHFFRIDYTLLSAVTSVVVTYTIIILQSLKF